MRKKWIEVNSSQIKRISYEESLQTLYIEFRNGSTYSYEGVTPKEYVDFKEAPSIGKFFYANIKHVKPYKQIL
jgi:hypothetical protein